MLVLRWSARVYIPYTRPWQRERVGLYGTEKSGREKFVLLTRL